MNFCPHTEFTRVQVCPFIPTVFIVFIPTVFIVCFYSLHASVRHLRAIKGSNGHVKLLQVVLVHKSMHVITLRIYYVK